MIRPRILTIACAAAALAAMAATSASAQDPVGDWHGVMTLSGQQVRSVIHIERTASGVYAGVTGSPELGRWDIPLEDVTFVDGDLSFAYPGGNAHFEGSWDADASAWVGDYANADGSGTITYEPGLLGLPVIDGLDGRWEGVLDAQGAKLRLVFRVLTNANGTSAQMDSPDQLTSGIPVSAVSRDGDAVAFEVAGLNGRYAGALTADGESLTGTWSQSGLDFPLDLTRSEEEAATPVRPQTPQPPFPYSVEETGFDNSAAPEAPDAPGVHLACTLTSPEGEGPFPVAYLITGSGQQDRDETLFAHKPFFVLADRLSRAGIAVLRCDDRGVGGSTGDFAAATLDDFVSDTRAALAFLRGRPDIDPARIGLIGHSEGGVVGPIVAAQDHDIAFVVMMAGVGVPGEDLLVAQGQAIQRAMGAPDAQVAAAGALNRRVFDAVLAAPDATAAADATRDILRTVAAAQGVTGDAADQMIEPQVARVSDAQFRALLAYDPRPVLPQITAPVLAINGSKDTQVPADQNLPALRELFADNPDATVTQLEGLNHLFQTADTGAPGEYADIEETIAPAALDAITDWVAARMLRDE